MCFYIQELSSLLISGGVPGTVVSGTTAESQCRYCEPNHLPLTRGVQSGFGVKVTWEKTCPSVHS